MFNSIFNFLFGWMKNEKTAVQAVIQVLAAEAFSRRSGLAAKLLPYLDTLGASLRVGTIASSAAAGAFISNAIAKADFKPEEIAIVSLFLGSLQAQIADKKIPINNMSDVEEYVSWIRSTAAIYAVQQK